MRSTQKAILLVCATFCLLTYFTDYSLGFRNAVLLEYGYYNWQAGSFGQGNFWRFTLIRNFPPSPKHFPTFEPGLGVTYYSMNKIDQPPGLSTDLTNLQGELTDYFVHFAGRYNLALSKATALFIGGRIGLHFTDWNFTGNPASNPTVPYGYKDKYEALGLDVFAGLRAEPFPIPLGAQFEFGTSNPFENVGDEVPFALGVSGGLYYRF